MVDNITKNQLIKIYDILYAQAKSLFDKYNPCQVGKTMWNETICAKGIPCCSPCKYLGLNGCRVKCLG